MVGWVERSETHHFRARWFSFHFIFDDLSTTEPLNEKTIPTSSRQFELRGRPGLPTAMLGKGVYPPHRFLNTEMYWLILSLKLTNAIVKRGFNLKSKTVAHILIQKKGTIKQAPLPKGSPSWEDLSQMTWEQIELGAKENRAGFKIVRKLLTDKRFDK